MLDLTDPATIDAQDQADLDLIPVDERSANWASRRKLIQRFKAAVHTHGIAAQLSRCVWCTLPVGAAGHRTPHRDHIAPKKLYPQWTFTPKNLAIACEYCNGFSVKVDLDTIEVVDAQYDQCVFRIVHPYIDVVSLHVDFMEDQVAAQRVVIQGHTPKGIWTIGQLKLDSPEMTNLRARELAADRAVKKLSPYYQTLLAQATGRQATVLP